MNRKLHNTILAFSISGGFLMLALMAAAPLPSRPAAMPTAAMSGPASLARVAADRAIEARTRDYEAEMGRAASTAEMIALSSEFLAEIAAEAALAAVLQEAEAPAPQAKAERPRGEGRRRSALAMPYFSFAHGLRGGGS